MAREKEIIFTHLPPEHSRGILTQSQLSAPAQTLPPPCHGRVYGGHLHSCPHPNSLHSHYRHCTEVSFLCTCLQWKSGRHCVSDASFSLSLKSSNAVEGWSAGNTHTHDSRMHRAYGRPTWGPLSHLETRVLARCIVSVLPMRVHRNP